MFFGATAVLRDRLNELKWTEDSTSVSREDRPGTGHLNEYLLLLLYWDFISWLHLTRAMHIHQILLRRGTSSHIQSDKHLPG